MKAISGKEKKDIARDGGERKAKSGNSSIISISFIEIYHITRQTIDECFSRSNVSLAQLERER
jgi:hypothetical protein